MLKDYGFLPKEVSLMKPSDRIKAIIKFQDEVVKK
jgi:hypothetical protein